MTRVELQRIVKAFGDQTVLDELDLTIESGSYVVLLGPSGCGKTTTLRMVAGLDSPDSGDVLFDDIPNGGREPRHRDVSMVFQQDGLYPHMTVGDSIRFALRGRMSASDMKTRVGDAAALTGVERLLDRYPSGLSGGELRRAAIAKAVARQTAIRLLDEPLSALDVSVRHALQNDLLRWHAAFPGTSIHVTHDGQEAMRLADKIAVMQSGRIVQFASPDEVYRRPQTIAVAQAIGTPPINFIPARIIEGDLRFDQTACRWRSQIRFEGADRDVVVGIRPPSFTLIDSAEHGADRKDSGGRDLEGLVVAGELLDLRPVEHDLQLTVAIAPSPSTLGPSALESLTAVVSRRSLTRGTEPGRPIALLARFDEVHLFDAKLGTRIDTNPDR